MNKHLRLHNQVQEHDQTDKNQHTWFPHTADELGLMTVDHATELDVLHRKYQDKVDGCVEQEKHGFQRSCPVSCEITKMCAKVFPELDQVDEKHPGERNISLGDEQLTLAEVNPVSYEGSSYYQPHQKDVSGHGVKQQQEGVIAECFHIKESCAQKSQTESGLSWDASRVPLQQSCDYSRVKLMCSFRGRIMPRPADGKLRYVGGETRIVTVSKDIDLKEFMLKMTELYGWPLGLKYQLPDDDLDALISVSSNDDMQNMLEEYEKLEAAGVDFRLRLFCYSSPEEIEVFNHDCCSSLEQLYIDAINGESDKVYMHHTGNDLPDHSENGAKSVTYDHTCGKFLSNFQSGPSSLPSSPAVTARPGSHLRQARCGGDEFLSEQVSKVKLPACGTDVHFQEIDQDGPVTSSYFDCIYQDQQYHMRTESPRIVHPDLAVPKVENWSFIEPERQSTDPQSKLVRCLDPQMEFMEYRTTGGPKDRQHQSGELLVSQVESPRFLQQNKLTLCQQHQIRKLHGDGRIDASQHCQEVQHAAHQVQVSHLHLLLGCDGSACQCDCQSASHGYLESPASQGLALALSYQKGSAPSSPRVISHEYPGSCSCGYVYSQPNLNIQHCCGKGTHHFVDHSTRRHGLPVSSSCFDSPAHAGESCTLQQHSYFIDPADMDHREQVGGLWQHAYGKHAPGCHIRSCFCKQAAQSLHVESHLSESAYDSNLTVCSCCHEYVKQQKKVREGDAFQSNKQDELAGWVVDGRYPIYRTNCGRVMLFQHESKKAEYEKRTRMDGDTSGFLNHLPNDPVQPKRSPMENGEHCSTDVLRSSGMKKPSVSLAFATVSEEDYNRKPPGSWIMGSHGPNYLHDALHSSTGQSLRFDIERTSLHSHDGVEVHDRAHDLQSHFGDNVGVPHTSNVASTMAPGSFSLSSPVYKVCGVTPQDWKELMTPDIISLNSLSPSFIDPATSFTWHQTLSPVRLGKSAADSDTNTFMYPVYDQSPLGSRINGEFSFGAGEIRYASSTEINVDDQEALASRMSMTGLLAKDMISSILESCSNERTCEEETNLVDRELVGVDFLPVNGTGFKDDCNDDIKRIGGDERKHVMDASVESSLKFAIYKKDFPIMQSDNNPTSTEDKAGESVAEESKESILSRAEADAFAQDLQIIRNVDLEDLKELGSGTFGTVYHGKWRGSDVAIKRIKASFFMGPSSEQERLLADFWKEACTLGKLHHPNVVAFYGVVPDGPGGTLATVTEYMVNGSLKQVFRRKDRTIDRRKRLFIAMDAAFGMEYLHCKNIVHFDLKCENLLVNMRDAHRPICKVGDFGLSKVKHQTLVSGGVRGTLPWMAPELLSGNCSMVTEKVDVYSFGIVMWELLTGEEPYASMHCGTIIGGIVNNTLRPTIPTWCDPGWRQLMERCWAGDPAERPSFSEVASELRALAASMNLK